MDRLRIPTSPSPSPLPPGNPYGTYTDQQRMSSTSTLTDFSDKPTKSLTVNDPSDHDRYRYGYPPQLLAPDYPALPPRTVITEKNRWTPPTLRARIAIPMVLLMIATAVGIEVTYAFAIKMNGFSVDLIEKYGSPQFFGSFLPVVFILPLVLYCLTVNHEVNRLQPYISASHGNAPPQQTVLVSYINQNRFLVAIQSLKHGHRLVAAATILSFILTLWQPFSAALFVVRQTNQIADNYGLIFVTAQLGVRPSFTDLDAFLAAAGYAEAAVVHGLGDPPFVRGGWSISPFEFPNQPKNATMTLDVQAVWTDPGCETLNPQFNKTADGSYTVTATRGSCVVNFTTDQTQGDQAFGVVPVNGCDQSANLEERFKPVVFWFWAFDGPTASVIYCSPSVETHLVNANVSLSTQLVNTDPRKVRELSSNVTAGEPFNGRALNGLFFPNSTNPFVNARATAVRSAIPNAIHKAAADNPRGLASSLRDIPGQLARVKKVYTQYLAIAAKSDFFVPAQSTAQPTLQTWMPRLWMDKLASHVLASLLIFIALAMSILQFAHRKQRSRLFLAGPPGSIASDVSMTSSAKFGLLLNAGDTEQDLERKLHGMRFGIEHSTGQIIVEREDANGMLRHVQAESVRYPHEDVRASLLSDEAHPRSEHRDSFVGLRQDRESYATSRSGGRTSTVMSPLAGARFSQTKFSPLYSPTPSPSATLFSPSVPRRTTFTSPPPSATTPSPPSATRYSAPPGPPPPQLQARDSYHDPYAPNPA